MALKQSFVELSIPRDSLTVKMFFEKSFGFFLKSVAVFSKTICKTLSVSV